MHCAERKPVFPPVCAQMPYWGNSWKALKVLEVGASLNAFIEGNPRNKIEDTTWNARRISRSHQ